MSQSNQAPAGQNPNPLWQQSKLASGLYVVATPIGNLRDITLRALDTLASCDEVICEDTRISRKLLSHYQIHKPTAIYNDQSGPNDVDNIVKSIKNGAAIALISDAGTPLISDPGYRLVKTLQEQGMPVFTIPGPNAAISALSISGLPTDKFLFVGFLPPKTVARKKALLEYSHLSYSLVFYETAKRIPATWEALNEAMPDRPAAILRELTKLYEEVQYGTVNELFTFVKEELTRKGEFVIVIGPPTDQQQREVLIDDQLAEIIRALPTKAAANLLKESFALSKSEAYQKALDIKQITTLDE